MKSSRRSKDLPLYCEECGDYCAAERLLMCTRCKRIKCIKHTELDVTQKHKHESIVASNGRTFKIRYGNCEHCATTSSSASKVTYAKAAAYATGTGLPLSIEEKDEDQSKTTSLSSSDFPILSPIQSEGEDEDDEETLQKSSKIKAVSPTSFDEGPPNSAAATTTPPMKIGAVPTKYANVEHLVVNCEFEGYDAYVGPTSFWENPYAIGRDGSRITVIKQYEAYIKRTPRIWNKLPELRGLKLGCICAPNLCHAHVLAFHADEYTGTIPEPGWEDDTTTTFGQSEQPAPLQPPMTQMSMNIGGGGGGGRTAYIVPSYPHRQPYNEWNDPRMIVPLNPPTINHQQFYRVEPGYPLPAHNNSE